MRRSTNRILVSHAGTAPRPEGLELPEAVKAVVQKQVEVGIDIVNDGELSKSNFTSYVRDRLGGIQPADSAHFKAALASVSGEVEGFLPAVAPGTVEHWLYNQHYQTDEEFLFALADALHDEYKAITDAGLNLQIDDPDLPDGWQMFPQMTVSDYRRYAAPRVEALNHALRDIPREQIRLHVCWGSGHGPHQNDIPLEHIVDLILRVKAQVYSVEAANPRHDHEWRVWQNVRLPEGKSLMPGVVGHAADIIEHPRLVAERLMRYANIVGKQNVVAGTDCG